VSREVWKIVEAKARKTGVAKTKERRGKRKKDNRCKESDREIGNLG